MYCEEAKKYSSRVMAHKDMDIVLRDCDANDEIALERLFLQLGYKISKEEIQEKLITLSGILGSHQILAQNSFSNSWLHRFANLPLGTPG